MQILDLSLCCIRSGKVLSLELIFLIRKTMTPPSVSRNSFQLKILSSWQRRSPGQKSPRASPRALVRPLINARDSPTDSRHPSKSLKAKKPGKLKKNHSINKLTRQIKLFQRNHMANAVMRHDVCTNPYQITKARKDIRTRGMGLQPQHSRGRGRRSQVHGLKQTDVCVRE